MTALTDSNRANIASVGTVEQSFSSPVVVLQSKAVFLGGYDSSKTSVVENTIYTINTATEAKVKFGYRSQLARMATYWFKTSSSAISMIPLTADVNGVASQHTITFTDNATSSGTIVLRAGSYLTSEVITVSIASGDTPTEIASKVVSAVSSVLTLPLTADSTDGVVTLTASTADITSDDLKITINNSSTDDDLPDGTSYVIAKSESGVGYADVDSALLVVASETTGWKTALIQPYNSTIYLDKVLEACGNPNSQTSLYSAIDYRPFVSYVCDRTGGSDGLDDITEITLARPNDCVNLIAAAPSSPELGYEIASALAAKISDRAESSTDSATAYIDLDIDYLYGPLVATDDWTTYTGDVTVNSFYNRDTAVTSGVTPLKYANNTMNIGDCVTPWLPEDDQNAPFKYVVNSRKTWNMRSSYYTYLNSSVIKGLPIVRFTSAVDDGVSVVSTSSVDDGVAKVTSAIAGKAWIYDKSFTLNNTTVTEKEDNSDRFVIYIPAILSGNLRQTDSDVAVTRDFTVVDITLEV